MFRRLGIGFSRSDRVAVVDRHIDVVTSLMP
jgi:hypothetical protein